VKLALLAVFLALPGCAAALPAAQAGCKAVSAVNDACMLLTFLGSDGRVHTVECSKQELNAWGAAVERKHTLGDPWRPDP
jgi:hypothetical protein